MKTLDTLLKDISLERFLNKHFTKIPFSSPDTAKEFSRLLTWETIKTVLEEKKSILRIVKDGVVTKDCVDIDYNEAKKFHNEGHTLLLRYAEKSHPSLKKLADEFSEYFNTEVDIQLYCTPEGNNAFGWHYDIEEVFIIQTKGSKLYTIRTNTVHPIPLLSSIPKDLQYEKETSELTLQVLLQEGDWLYIPSGWWHVAKTQEESMHISIGLMPRSAIDMIGFLEKYLVQFPEWRTRFPRHRKTPPEEDISLYLNAFETLGKNLSEKISSPEFVRDFLHYYKTT